MRNKIKQMIKKEEGFTLVELLAVIVILGIIVAIAVPAIGTVVSDARTDANAAEQELIVDAARLYYISADSNAEDPVKISTLIDEGFLNLRQGTNVDVSDSISRDEANGSD